MIPSSKTPSHLSSSNGFTLVELLIVIIIIAIVVSFAYPSLMSEFKKMEARRLSAQMQQMLTDTRQDAIVYHSPVTLCIADNSQQCVNRNGNRWLRFIDKNTNHRLDASDRLLETTELIQRFGSVSTSAALNRPHIIMEPENGRPIGYMGHLKYCPQDGDTQYMFKVTFSKTGIIKHVPFLVDATDC